MTLEGLPVIAALIIAVFLIIWAVKVIKETIWSGVIVLLILAILFFGFGVTPVRVFDEILLIPQHLSEFWQSLIRVFQR